MLFAVSLATAGMSYAEPGPKGMIITTESPHLSINYSQSMPVGSKAYAEGNNIIYFQTARDDNGRYSVIIDDVKIYPDTNNLSQYCSAIRVDMGINNNLPYYNFIGLRGNGGIDCKAIENNTATTKLIIKTNSIQN